MNKLDIAVKLLAGFCANPAIFASSSQIGWSLVNCTEQQLASYAFNLAEAFMVEWGRPLDDSQEAKDWAEHPYG